MNLKTWCLQIWGVNTLSCLQYKNIIVDKNQSIPYFPPHCGIQCSIPSKVCPLRKRLPLSCHKNSSQIFDATKLWKHAIPLTYNTKTLMSNISETHRFSPQMRLIAYPDHKTTLNLTLGCSKFTVYIFFSFLWLSNHDIKGNLITRNNSLLSTVFLGQSEFLGRISLMPNVLKVTLIVY